MKAEDMIKETMWERTAPRWKFWDKQEAKRLYCTCGWERSIRRGYHSAFAAYASKYMLSIELAEHINSHKPKKKAVKKAAKKKVTKK